MTLLAAGHETTATALAWALERLARHPATDLSDDAHIDAAVKEVLRTRPVLSITARKTLQPYALDGYTLPEGVYVAACLYLAHRRAGTDFDPARFLDGASGPVHVRPLRRRHAPLPRRRVRPAGDARGAPSGLTTLHIAPRSRAG